MFTSQAPTAPTATPIDQQQWFVLFLDLLGFGDLVEEFPTTMISRRSKTFTSPSAARFGHFHAILDSVEAEVEAIPRRAMIFSDCAFLVYENALLAAVGSTRLLRSFLLAHVPVRMALACGTCETSRFSSDSFRNFSLIRAMFFGTGVVRASRTEARGGKGCRIFLHRSVEPYLQDIRMRIPVVRLPQPNELTHWELCYLHEEQVWTGQTAEDAAHGDSDMRHALEEIRNDSGQPLSPDVAIHYDETFAALERMRNALGRPLMIQPNALPTGL